MPYESKQSLPKQIKDNLPDHAQDIWKEAYNSALDQYKDREDPEQVAAQVAWAAVKNDYKKNTEGKWVKKIN